MSLVAIASSNEAHIFRYSLLTRHPKLSVPASYGQVPLVGEKFVGAQEYKHHAEKICDGLLGAVTTER